ncbi:unnamed protein product, partial [Pylaiella littoralis]
SGQHPGVVPYRIPTTLDVAGTSVSPTKERCGMEVTALRDALGQHDEEHDSGVSPS